MKQFGISRLPVDQSNYSQYTLSQVDDAKMHQEVLQFFLSAVIMNCLRILTSMLRESE